jgi:hypothetical protein
MKTRNFGQIQSASPIRYWAIQLYEPVTADKYVVNLPTAIGRVLSFSAPPLDERGFNMPGFVRSGETEPQRCARQKRWMSANEIHALENQDRI